MWLQQLNKNKGEAIIMGKKKRKIYFKSLDELAKEKLESMISVGESKSEDRKEDGGTRGHIYSWDTYSVYRRHVLYFIRWVMENYPDCTTLKAAKRLVPEWLQFRADFIKDNGEHLSAWTIKLETSALNKLYELDDTKDRFKCPVVRERGNIHRSREEADRDKHFSTTKNADLIHFCEGVGARRDVLEKMKGDDYWTRDRMQQKLKELSAMDESTLTKREKVIKRAIREALETYSGDNIACLEEMQDFVLHRQDKNGKHRFAPIVGPHKDDIVLRFTETGENEKVWPTVHDACDVHYYRGNYAKTIYKMCARDIEDIPCDKYHGGIHRMYQSDVYFCRKEKAGMKYDKQALRICSKALGHTRLNVIVDHYLYGLD